MQFTVREGTGRGEGANLRRSYLSKLCTTQLRNMTMAESCSSDKAPINLGDL
jgi:hypothetical protein